MSRKRERDDEPVFTPRVAADGNSARATFPVDDVLADNEFPQKVFHAYQALVSTARELLAAHQGVANRTEATEGSATCRTCVVDKATFDVYRKRLPPRMEDFNQRYRKMLKVGEGTFAEVFIVRDTQFHHCVVMKRVHRPLLLGKRRGTGCLHPTVLREIAILFLADHPNIIPLIDFHFLEDGSCILILPLVSHDLCGLMRLWRRSGTDGMYPKRRHGLLPIPYVKCFVKQLLEGLHYLHSRSIWHRDLKPSNLLVHHDGTLFIIDFGWSRFAPEDRVKECVRVREAHHEGMPPGLQPLTGPPCATNYRPPEVLVGGKSESYYDGAAVDMWAVGCIVFELITGQPLVSGKVSEIAALEQLVAQLGAPPSRLGELVSPTKTDRIRSAFLLELRSRRSKGLARDRVATAAGGTPAAADFVLSLLTWSPRERMHCRAALHHAWLQSDVPLACNKDVVVLPTTNTYNFLLNYQHDTGGLPR